MSCVRVFAALLALLILPTATVAWAQPFSISSRNWIVKNLSTEVDRAGWKTEYYFRNSLRVYIVSLGEIGDRKKLAVHVTDIQRQQFAHLYAENGDVRSLSGPSRLLAEIGSTNVVCGLPSHVQEMLEDIGLAQECPKA